MPRIPTDEKRLLQEILERARVQGRPSESQIERERQQAQQLASFISGKMQEKALSCASLAAQIDIEVVFIKTLLDGNFPVSELSQDMLKSLATGLGCTMIELVWAMDVDDLR